MCGAVSFVLGPKVDWCVGIMYEGQPQTLNAGQVKAGVLRAVLAAVL